MQTEKDIESITVATRITRAMWEAMLKFALLVLVPLVIVLVWIALMYDKLLANPFLAILLVLGVLAILFGGTIRFGPFKIQKAVVKNQKHQPEPKTRSQKHKLNKRNALFLKK